MKTFGLGLLLGVLLSLALLYFADFTEDPDSVGVTVTIIIAFCIAQIITLASKFILNLLLKRNAASPQTNLVFLFILPALTLQSCSTTKSGNYTGPTATDNWTNTSAQDAGDERNFTAYRNYLYRDNPDTNEYGAYGYVVFASNPNIGYSPRQMITHSAFIKVFSEVQNANQTILPPQYYMVTYWPLQTKTTPTLTGPTTKQALTQYDFDLATRIAAKVNLPNSRGPFLVAWDRPFHFASFTPQYDSLVLDMTHFVNKDIERGMRLWRKIIVKGPGQWNNSETYYLKVKENFRGLTQIYGHAILRFIKNN